MLEIMKFIAELAERVGYAEAKLEEAESLIDEMDEALCEDEDGDEYEYGDDDGDECDENNDYDADENPVVTVIFADGSRVDV